MRVLRKNNVHFIDFIFYFSGAFILKKFIVTCANNIRILRGYFLFSYDLYDLKSKLKFTKIAQLVHGIALLFQISLLFIEDSFLGILNSVILILFELNLVLLQEHIKRRLIRIIRKKEQKYNRYYYR